MHKLVASKLPDEKVWPVYRTNKGEGSVVLKRKTMVTAYPDSIKRAAIENSPQGWGEDFRKAIEEKYVDALRAKATPRG